MMFGRNNEYAQDSTLIIKFTIENLHKDKVTDYQMMENEDNLHKISVAKSEIVFVDLPEFFKVEDRRHQIKNLKQRSLKKVGQDLSLFAVNHFIKLNLEERAKAKKNAGTNLNDLSFQCETYELDARNFKKC